MTNPYTTESLHKHDTGETLGPGQSTPWTSCKNGDSTVEKLKVTA